MICVTAARVDDIAHVICGDGVAGTGVTGGTGGGADTTEGDPNNATVGIMLTLLLLTWLLREVIPVILILMLLLPV